MSKKNNAYQRLWEERPHVCTGCGRSDMLTHSHLIPVSRRKDLEADKRNITYHCISCHKVWESHEPSKMRTLMDYWDNMGTIEELDKEYHQLLKAKEK